MVFYKIEANISQGHGENEGLTEEERGCLPYELFEKSDALFQKSGQRNIIFTTVIRRKTATFAMAVKDVFCVERLIEQYLKFFPFEIKKLHIDEVTFSTFTTLLHGADRNGYIRDEFELLECFELQDLNSFRSGTDFGESILPSEFSRENAETVCDSLFFKETLSPEIERIYSVDATNKPLGHPVHYMVSTDDRETRKIVCRTLLSALYANGRIKNKRYFFVDIDGAHDPSNCLTENLYKSSEGGAVLIRYIKNEESEGPFSNHSQNTIHSICKIAAKYKNKVLTVFCLPKAANKTQEEIFANWGVSPFIELYEDVIFGEEAVKYLKIKAKENKIRWDNKLTGAINDPQKGYSADQLNKIFDAWYDQKMRSKIYPQYKTAETVKMKIKNAPHRGSAYERLEKLIGLDNAKSVINNALNYFKAQKIFADRGMIARRPSMHMVFTGNPGTAKTTAARLFAEIMKENGLLSGGGIHEVGRADLVGKYVGTTAPLVKAAFKQAKGGVLFIDEAYSLVDDRDGLFGDEAINTIVQEMENNRNDTVVIFAGYPDKMEGFLNKNPGLRSRIAFHISFEDYTATELCHIAELIAEENNYLLSNTAIEKLETVFETAREQSDFGNGRFARNVIEKAKMAQANRLMEMDIEKISDLELKTITADDIETPKAASQEKVVKIGFCA